MANFKDYALQYVLTEEEAKMKSAVSKAAADIEDSRGSSSVVFKWAESIKIWMPSTTTTTNEPGRGGEGEGEGEGDILARAKALGFLASTLELLGDGILRNDQIKMLIGFFGAMFGIDQKAGIAPSTKALRQLTRMKAFKPSQGNNIIDHLTELGDDFRLQAPLTRLEVYELVRSLVENEAVASELQFKHGVACGFVTDLLQMCKNERDPKNLMVWFDILRTFLDAYSPSAAISEEIFKTFSAYFPISLRASAIPVGVTAEDLKISLRGCFSVHYCVAEHVFPFLIQKLDQGDAITVSVKVDILQTLEACLAKYAHVEKSIVPFTERIWNSLKYEVRNGEVEETIQGTLQTLRVLSSRLEGNSLKDFTQPILRDCLDDLTNPTYTLQSGKLLSSIYSASPAAYSIVVQTLMPHIKMNLRQTKSPAHTQDIVIVLNSILSARSNLVAEDSNNKNHVSESIEAVSPVLTTAFEEVFLPLWKDATSGTDATNNKANTLKEVVKGLALLVAQEKDSGDVLPWSLLCTESTCSRVLSLLSQIILDSPLGGYSDEKQVEIEDEAVLSLQKVVTAYPAGFVDLLDRAKSRFSQMGTPNALELLTTRLAFIGCSEAPRVIGDFHNFLCLTSAFLEEIHNALKSYKNAQMTAVFVAAIHCSMLNFRETLPKGQNKSGIASPIGLEWVSQVTSSYPNFPQLDMGLAGDWKIVGSTPGNKSSWTEFSKICLFITRQLYRRATVVFPEGPDPLGLVVGLVDHWELLDYLAAMTAFVVQDLTAETQSILSLSTEVICLFRKDDSFAGASVKDSLQADDRITFSANNDLELIRLSQGVLQGLWPNSMMEMCENGMCLRLARQVLGFGSRPRPRQQKSANGIICILSNKYARKAESWPSLVKIVDDKLNVVLADTNSTNLALQLRHLQVSLAFIAGALPNYDKHVSQLVRKLVEVPSHVTIGLYAAREFSTLLSPKQELSAENHAISKPLGKQWAYAQVAKPMFEKAAPFNSTLPEGHNYAVAVMNMLKHLPFELYEDDGESVVRIAIPALTSLGVGPDVEAALKILLQFVEHKPDVLKQRLNAVIQGALGLFDRAKGGRKEAQKDETSGVITRVNPPLYRKLALVLIACLPLSFEARYLLPHAAKLQKVLSMACGDSVREVRQAALKARVSWVNVN